MATIPCFCRCPCHTSQPVEPPVEPPVDIPTAKPIDLRKWKLTLPTGTKEEPNEIFYPALETYEDMYFDKGGPHDVFEGYRFIAPVGGVTTKGSGYPRCELREMIPSRKEAPTVITFDQLKDFNENKPVKAAWNINKGQKHTMTWTGYVVETPLVKPQVVIGQIHDSEDDLVMVRFTNTPRSTLDIMYDGKTRFQIPYKLKQEYELTIECVHFLIRVILNKEEVFRVTSPWKQGCYFKVGAYTQSNPLKGDKPSSRSVVVVEKVQVEHQSEVSAQ